jgi:hypothetical protein
MWSVPRELLGRGLRKRPVSCCWPSGPGKELGCSERKKKMRVVCLHLG